MSFIRRVLVATLAAFAVAAPGSASSTGGLPHELVADVPLPGPGNRFDYTSFDAAKNRLYLAHMDADELLVFDVRRRKVVRTIHAPGVHGVISVPSAHRVYASATDDDELYTIDDRSFAVTARADAGSYPDGLAFDPVHRRVFVSDESGGIEAVFDASGHRIGEVDLGGEAGNVQYDTKSGRILADAQTRNEVAVVDPRSLRIVRRVALPGCEHDHGLSVDSPRRVAFVACDGNAALLTLDLTRMKVIGATTVGSNPDVLAFDRSARRLYVAAESGEIAMFAERGRHLVKLGQGDVAPEAHTVAVDPRTHLVYFPLEEGPGGKPVLRIMRPR